MISITQHGASSADVFTRKLLATRVRVDPSVIGRLGLGLDPTDRPIGQIIFETTAMASDALMLTCGVAGEARLLANGRRQILALRFPGDILTPKCGEVLVALTRVRTTNGARLMACLADSSADFQPLRRAWVSADRTDQAILRDQVVRLGRMSALERMAHILLEVHERLAQIGLAQESTFHLPLTQEVVSDVVGLSVVHLNRTLQSLRRMGLIATKQGYVSLLDREQLVALATYVSRYPMAWQPEGTLLTRRGGLAETGCRARAKSGRAGVPHVSAPVGDERRANREAFADKLPVG